MKILVLGTNGSITQTTCKMMESVPDWTVIKRKVLYGSEEYADTNSHKNGSYNIIVANLEDFTEASYILVGKIKAQYPNVPLLVMDSYQQGILVDALLKSGASGYVQLGTGEEKLFNAIHEVVNGNQPVITENTY